MVEPAPKTIFRVRKSFSRAFCFETKSSLGSLAAVVLGVPTSTASLERLFSDAGRAITRRHPRLQPRNAAGLIFGHANIQFGVTGRLAGCFSETPTRFPSNIVGPFWWTQGCLFVFMVFRPYFNGHKTIPKTIFDQPKSFLAVSLQNHLQT